MIPKLYASFLENEMKIMMQLQHNELIHCTRKLATFLLKRKYDGGKNNF